MTKRTNIKLNLLAGALAVVVGLAPAGAAFADDTTKPTTGTVIFDSASKQAVLTQVPSTLAADSNDINSLASGDKTINLTYADKDNQIIITDFSGTGAGWNLTANIETPFANANHVNSALEDATISINKGDSTISNVTDSSVQATDATISTTKSNILTANANEGMGVTTDSIAKFTLNIPAHNRLYTGTYTASITWTLGAVPTTGGN
ncbi:WxL domain-containing protein [Oenococcus kitaharae]|uniref:Cell surface protein n=1 Tax=Oenococcus kitaharae DSM 17330 TaxID=1045004 RepID=G9WIN3_9LACO|nr:WxL domain-containing protein [Oenococcus kitaharae]EHN58172.1 cell surface protein [Oenococcus kitaharae DSM 17330]OEY81630.1 hypothetical protein NT95_09105 [Oenococcus kitaharae]OEY83115.1 hypothetical protein NV75_07205 [Oenococcus kitaharae]OEY84339.1 hypothetical protein NT96_03430 [Oenococcus kitaharae]